MMDIDFSLVLVILSAVSGVIWLLDSLVFSKPRHEKLADFLKERGISADEFRAYAETLDESGKPLPVKDKAKAPAQDPVRLRNLEAAAALNRFPAPVEYARSFFPILFAVLVLRSFLFEPFQIPSGSMIPTLNIGDFIVVNKFAYGLRLPVVETKILDVGDPKRGDVMVFVPPHDPHYFIKRVIGLPGDHVQYKDNVVYVNGEAMSQELVGTVVDNEGARQQLSRETIGGVTHDIYTVGSGSFSRLYEELPPEGRTIAEGEYFMMGDNRDNSYDSRGWGPASEGKIVGKAVAVWMHKEPGWHLPTFGQNRLIKNAE